MLKLVNIQMFFIGFDQICSVDPEQYINLNTCQFRFLLAE